MAVRPDPYEPGYYILNATVYEVRLSHAGDWYAIECLMGRKRQYVGRVGHLRADCKLLANEVELLKKARII